MFYKVMGGIFLMDLVRNPFFFGFWVFVKVMGHNKTSFPFCCFVKVLDEFFRTKNGYWKMFCQ